MTFSRSSGGHGAMPFHVRNQMSTANPAKRLTKLPISGSLGCHHKVAALGKILVFQNPCRKQTG